MRTMVQAGVRLCPDQVTIITIVLRVCAHVCTRVHEENRCESLCLWGFWSFRFGNRTAVLLYRLFLARMAINPHGTRLLLQPPPSVARGQ